MLIPLGIWLLLAPALVREISEVFQKAWYEMLPKLTKAFACNSNALAGACARAACASSSMVELSLAVHPSPSQWTDTHTSTVKEISPKLITRASTPVELDSNPTLCHGCETTTLMPTSWLVCLLHCIDCKINKLYLASMCQIPTIEGLFWSLKLIFTIWGWRAGSSHAALF